MNAVGWGRIATVAAVVLCLSTVAPIWWGLPRWGEYLLNLAWMVGFIICAYAYARSREQERDKL